MMPPDALISSAGHLHPELGVAADRAEEAGQRHQMADLYSRGLCAEDGWRSDRGGAGKGGAGLQQVRRL
jgi:hypothetical protein